MQEPLLKKRINLTGSHFWKCCMFSVCMELWVFPGHRRCLANSKSCIPPCMGCFSCFGALPDPSAGLQRGWSWGPQSAAVKGSWVVQSNIWTRTSGYQKSFYSDDSQMSLCSLSWKLVTTNGGFCRKRTWYGNKFYWKTELHDSWGSAQLFMLIDRESLAHVVWCVGLALVSFVSQDIKSVIRDHLISWGDSMAGKEPLNLSDPGNTVCQKMSSSTVRKFLHR